MAIIGVIISINFARYFQELLLPYAFLYLVSGILTIFNIVYLSVYNYIKNRENLYSASKLINGFANFQVLIDLVILTLLLYGSGGLYSPFIYFYVFHMVIASMLLPPIWAFVQGGIAMLFFTSLIVLSSFRIIPDFTLTGFGPQPGDDVYTLFIASRLGGLISTLFILIFMVSSISKQLNKKESLLRQLNEELTLANDKKSKYILQVTHELRAPLAAVQGYLKVALEGYVGKVEGKLKEMLENISKRTERMLNMVNELLDIANLKRAVNTKVDKEVCNIREEINKAIHLFDHQLTKKRINLVIEADDDLEFSVNAEQFYIMLTNIINNAIKYSNSETEVKIVASLSDCKLCVKVHDQGIGIPEKDLDNIFDEYFRSQNAVENEQDGTGLGLALVSNIVKNHEGTIRVNSEVGKGSIFYIELPE